MMHVNEQSRPRRGAMMNPGSSQAAFVLCVTDGPDAGTSVTIDGRALPRVVVGSGPACTLQLTDASIARCHAILALSGSQLSISNVGEDGGVIVNGATVKEAFLRGGEVLRLGNTTLEVHRDSGVDLGPRGPLPASFGRVLGHCMAMRRLFASLAALAALDVSIVLEGEEGTGKELVAREIHRQSRRADGPFVELLASPAVTQTMARALIADARGGVLFVDRATDLSQAVQSALCDALVMSNDVRVIATARRSIVREVVEGNFDQGLAVLLGTGHIELPPLREREGDIAHLASAFWHELVEAEGVDRDGDDEEGLPTDFLPRFEQYPWPGNVRELKAAVHARRAMGPLGRSRQRKIGFETADEFLDAIVEGGVPFPEARERVVREFEGRFVARALLRSGNVTRAARASGLALRQFQLISARSRRQNAG